MLPLPPYNLADGETCPVKVFRDSPEWDRHEKWWMLPMHLLRDLYVCTYDTDGGRSHMDWLEREYPGCVFVY